MSFVQRFGPRDLAVLAVRRRRRGKRPLSVNIGLTITAAFVLIGIVSAFWTPYPASEPATGAFLSPPSWSHLFGTDSTGADIFSRALVATRTDVGITLAVVSLAFIVGTVWGATAGFVGGWFDELTKRVLQLINAFPALLLAMLVIYSLGRSMLDVIFVVALIPLPDYVRLSRAEVLTRKNWPFAEAAQMIGRGPVVVLFRHIVPNGLRPVVAYAAINASWVIATVGALGYLGLGIQPGSSEWGSMIASGQSGITSGQWWISFFPGLGIFLLALAFHMIGDGLADSEDVRRG